MSEVKELLNMLGQAEFGGYFFFFFFLVGNVVSLSCDVCRCMAPCDKMRFQMVRSQEHEHGKIELQLSSRMPGQSFLHFTSKPLLPYRKRCRSLPPPPFSPKNNKIG